MVALGAIWGFSFLFIKVGVAELHPVYLTLARCAAGALALLAVLLVTRDRLPREPRVWGHLTVIALLGNCLAFSLFGYGEQRISSVLAGIWNGTTPLVTLVIAVLVIRTERATRFRVLGMATGFVGLLVVLGVWQGVGGTALTGQLMCFAAAVCYGFSFPYMKRFVSGHASSGVALSAAQLIVATGVLAVAAPVFGGAPPNPLDLSAGVVGSVLALGLLGTGLAFVLNMRLIRLAGATTAAMVTYLIPLFATLAGVLFLDEDISWYEPVGALIVLAGVAISQRRAPSGGVPARLPDDRVGREPAALGSPGHPTGLQQSR